LGRKKNLLDDRCSGLEMGEMRMREKYEERKAVIFRKEGITEAQLSASPRAMLKLLLERSSLGQEKE